MKSTQILLLVLTLFIAGCLKKNEKQTSKAFLEVGSETVHLPDTIIYDVVIRDIDKESPWESERLQAFKQNAFVDSIFDQLYKGKLYAYDFYSGEEMSTKDIQNIEKTEGFSRSRVSKIQFNESWGFTKNGELLKKVNSMTFGIESYSKQGTFTGHKALFKVYTNPNER